MTQMRRIFADQIRANPKYGRRMNAAEYSSVDWEEKLRFHSLPSPLGDKEAKETVEQKPRMADKIIVRERIRLSEMKVDGTAFTARRS